MVAAVSPARPKSNCCADDSIVVGTTITRHKVPFCTAAYVAVDAQGAPAVRGTREGIRSHDASNACSAHCALMEHFTNQNAQRGGAGRPAFRQRYRVQTHAYSHAQRVSS